MAYRKTQHYQEGAPAPLFDRLIDENPLDQTEDRVANFLTVDELQESIIKELQNILDTRISSKIDLPEYSTSVALMLPEQFGLRDFAGLYAQSESGLREISSHIRAAIVRFEPRLHNPKVMVTKAKKESSNIEIAIGGEIMVDRKRIPVAFPMVLHNVLGRS